MKNISRKKIKTISAEEFDSRFDRGEDLSDYLDSKKAMVVKRVNIDFPEWMVKRLDEEAQKLNISRQAIVKTWIYEHLTSQNPKYSIRKRAA